MRMLKMHRRKHKLRKHRWYKGPHFGYTHNLQNPHEKLSFIKVDLPHLKRKFAMVKFMRSNWQKMLSYKNRWLFKEVNILTDINTTLLHFDNLPKIYKIRLERCKLNLSAALQRCESLHGKGNCEKQNAGVVQKKCPAGMERIGCCSCAKKCPDFFKSKGYYCLRSNIYKMDKFKQLKECQIQNKGQCMKVGEMYSPLCSKGFSQDGDLCRIDCPVGYKVIHGKCAKPDVISLGTPFSWIQSDN